jgi:predicted aspartyl protease
MNGHVDKHGRALVTVSVRPSDVGAAHQIEVWIDTGFNGDLVLPQQQIDDLALPQSGTVKAILADGQRLR